MDALKPDAPTSACPNCGTPRGPYDRFCTGCAADLGAPGAPIGVVGTLGVMNVAGPSSRQDRPQAAAPVARSLVGWVVPGSRSRPFAQSSAAPISAASQLGAMGRYPTAPALNSGAFRLWRTLGIMNRLLAVIWLVFLLLTLASYLGRRPDTGTGTLLAFVAVMAVFAIPSLLLWVSTPGLTRGEPAWLRSVVLIELLVVVLVTFGIALVPLVLIFVLAGNEP
jgi:hypothetical protein